MSEEILINVGLQETRVAIVENGILQEILHERFKKRSLVGNIYMGKVLRLLPGMQAAFVDIGLDRAAFLHTSDMVALSPHIRDLLKEGQSVVVQVIKDPIGTKGARLTTRLSLPSRYLVFMPSLAQVSVSARIENEKEKERLKGLVEGGYIIRTAAEGATSLEIQANQHYLIKQWELINNKLRFAKIGEMIHEDLSLSLRTLRDYSSQQTRRVLVDNEEEKKRVDRFIEDFIPYLKDKVELYPNARPLFDLYGIEDEIQKSLHRKVLLKSGGYLIIDQTEALTTIDVNTGAFVGHHNLETTIFKTNMEAAIAIPRQLRIRNLGGIIIIDFIDMEEEDHKAQVLGALEKGLSKDHAKNNISNVSSLGLIEMTRKRTRESLEHTLCETCTLCEGRGTIKTSETICNEVFRQVWRAAKTNGSKGYLVLAAQHIVNRLRDQEADTIRELENKIGASIQFQVENLYTQEQFDVVLM